MEGDCRSRAFLERKRSGDGDEENGKGVDSEEIEITQYATFSPNLWQDWLLKTMRDTADRENIRVKSHKFMYKKDP